MRIALLLLLVLPGSAWADSDKALAARYAPVIYQELSIYTNNEGDPDHAYDHPRRIDFDGDLDATNNLQSHRKQGVDRRAYVYYDVKTTPSHHFLTYTVYYVARTGAFMRRAENDLMGCTVVVDRNPSVKHPVVLLLLRRRNGFVAVGDIDRRRHEGKKISRSSVDLQFDHPEIDPARTHPRIFLNAWNHEARVLDPKRQKRMQLPFPFLSGQGVVFHYHPTVQHRAAQPGDLVVRYELLPMSKLYEVETTTDEGRRVAADDKGWRSRAPRLPHHWKVSDGIAPGALFRDPAGTVAKLFELSIDTTYENKEAKGLTGHVGQK